MKFSLLSSFVLAGLAWSAPTPTEDKSLEARATFAPFVGTNAYWLPFLASDADIDLSFKTMQAAGLKVVRTWAFNDATSCSGTYFQCWSSSTPVINTGSTGLQRLDVVVSTAAKYGIKLILPFVNNWGDYGGMDVYVSKMGGSGHSSFYTQANIKQAYKNYIAAVVNRYKSSSAIFAWELANEPRCAGCAVSVITAWATEISQYIKSLDSSHMVALGDEGFFNRGSNQAYPYQGGEGIDFEANLKISTLDFATFHMYTDSWGQTRDWGNQWITDHATVCKASGKACVLEEYGVNTDGDVRTTYMTQYHNAIKSGGITADMFWQYGLQLSNGLSHDDGYTIYPTESNYQSIVVNWAKSRV